MLLNYNFFFFLSKTFSSVGFLSWQIGAHDHYRSNLIIRNRPRSSHPVGACHFVPQWKKDNYITRVSFVTDYHGKHCAKICDLNEVCLAGEKIAQSGFWHIYIHKVYRPAAEQWPFSFSQMPTIINWRTLSLFANGQFLVWHANVLGMVHFCSD